MSNIFNFELSEKSSVTTKTINMSPLYLPLSNCQKNNEILFYKTEEEINELKKISFYESGDFQYKISTIPMDCKTDEAILFALLSYNKQIIQVSIKDLAIKIGVSKNNATDRKVKERIMNSINRHYYARFEVMKSGIPHTGFGIINNYKFDYPERNMLTINLDEEFIKQYLDSNQSIINLEKYCSLKNDYSRMIYSLINNVGGYGKEITINGAVLEKKLEEINPQKKQKIKKAIEELKDKKILSSGRINKNNSLTLIKSKIIQQKIKENIKQQNDKTISEIKGSEDIVKERQKIQNDIANGRIKGVLELDNAIKRIEAINKEINELTTNK